MLTLPTMMMAVEKPWKNGRFLQFENGTPFF